ncbi:MAG: UDP-2,3-diacylglucosamine diphosphatase LpxI [Endomicrobium sp.]|jgi:DUF1009 family protein|nr:UDP-2,3-diacylglucosamine diphosphatase LpxI [Endomicrobium sp.]
MENIGLIAGNNKFPILISKEIKNSGNKVICIALKEAIDTEMELRKESDKFYCISIGKFQKIIDTFKNENVKNIIMAGQVKHVTIYSAINMDWRAIKLLKNLPDKKTDTILKTIAKEFVKEGINLMPSHIYLFSSLATKGLMAGDKLSSEEIKNIEFGYKIAKGIASFDIGQTVVVKDKSVLAVESVEGTDECIKRAYELGGSNLIVVKVAKPNQDFRFDIPVVGLRTIYTLSENKVRVLALESDITLMLGKNEVIKKANEIGVTIFGI